MDTSTSLGNDDQLFPPAALRSLPNATVDLAGRNHDDPHFNYRFLIFLVLTFVLFTFFVLYFNRLFASIVSYGIRTWTWHKHRVYLDISALQISLLGGRIFFTGLRYHGSNETFLIQHGYITWRYWLRRVREVDIVADNPAEGAAPGKEKNAKLPCRVTVNLIGVEWFVYNRSPQYDSILAGLTRNHPQSANSTATADTDEKESLRERRTGHSAAGGEEGNRRFDPARAPEAEKRAPSDSSSPADGRTSIESDSHTGDGDRVQKRSDLPFLVQFFPIHVECDRAAAVIGNENTKGILTAKAKTISAVVDASHADTVDPYQQVFKIDFQHPVVQIKENEDYKSDQPARATGNTGVTKVATKANRFRRWWRKTLAPLRRMVPRWARPSRPNPLEADAALGVDPRIPGSDQWQGLARYLNDQDQDDKERWSSVEYAAESTVLDSPAATLVVYWDVVSKVTTHARQRRSTDIHIDVNGTTAPAWGMDFAIKGGQVSYGKKRGSRAKKEAKGEASQQRPAAWLEFKVSADSSVAYHMDMLASASGYQSGLTVDLTGSELRSAVNQNILWRGGSHRIECDLSTPLSWNSLRLWSFKVELDDLELFLLRDHIFLLIDLVDDWSTGPPPDYLVFTPFQYCLDLRLQRLKLYLNVNEGNIIDKPTSLDDNAYLILSAPLLAAKTSIPLDKYRPQQNAIPFDVRSDTLDLLFHSPQWTTQAAFTKSGEIGRTNDLDVILSIKTDDPRIMLPTNLYSSSQYIQAELSTLSVDLRFTNYYMDMELDISPLNLSLTGLSTDPESPEMESSNTQLFLDGIRVFGHRLFGLPPTEPTYLCNWDVSAGTVSGECTAEFLAALARGGTAFAFTFDDVENALVPYSSLVFDDVTFARVDVESVHLWLHVDEAAMLLSTDRITVNSNDWANSHYSKRADIDIPNIQVSCVDSESAARHKSRPDHPVDTIAYLQTNVRMASIGRKLHFSEKLSLQQELVRREDQRTTRTPFLLKPDCLDEFLPDPLEPPAQCAPAPPHPLHEAGDHALSGAADDNPSHSNFHQHSSVAFTSQYYTPYFTLAGVQPDASEVPLPAQHNEPPAYANDFLSGRGQDLNDIDASQFDEEHAYSSLMVEFTTAVIAFISPAAIKHGLSLVSALQPTEPDDILDTLQTSSLGKIFDGKKEKEAHGSVKDLLVKLPRASVRILNSSTFGLSQDVESEERDQYDVTITELGLVTRTTSYRGDAVDSLQMGSKTSLHLRLGSIELSASERSSTLEEPQAAVMVQIDQVVISVGAREITYFDADVGSIHQFLQDNAAPTWTVPPDAAELVIAAFQRWRSWDLDNISNAVVLRKIFPTLNETQAIGGDGLPVLGACRLGDMHFVLDPGPKENKVGIVDVSVRVEKMMKSDAAMLPETNTQNALLTTISVCCNEGAIHVNWEVCELIEDVLRLYNQSQERGKAVAKTAQKRHRPDQSAARTPAFHVVAEVIQGSIEVETVNLRSTTVTESFKVSGLMYGGDNVAQSLNVITHCTSVTSSLESHALLLSVFQLRDPSIFASLEHEKSDEASTQIVKSTVSSSSLKYVVKQDPTTLLEILDHLLKDEATQINQLLRHVAEHRQPQPKHKEDSNVRQRLSTFRFNVALFLERYIISVPLLQTLTYKITGNVARASCAANFGKEIIFDFDVKENSHEMHIDVRDEPRRISLMQIPPTNGRIRSQTGQSEHVLTVLSSVELMQLDASAVYSLLGALNRPQISSTIEEIQEQVKVVQRHFGDVFRPDTEPHPDPTNNKPDGGDSGKRTLIYDVHLTFAGLQVSAITPLGSYPKPVSQVLFSLDKLQLQAANRLDPQAPIMKYPEVHFNLKQIGFDIRRGQRDAMKSCGRIGAGVTMSAGAKEGSDGKEDWAFDFRSPDLDVNLSPEMVSTSLAVLAYLRDKIKDLDTSRELDYLRKLRESKPRITINDSSLEVEDEDIIDSVLSRLVYQFELQNIRASWNVETDSDPRSVNKEDLVLSIKLIQFGTRTKRSARLTIDSLQLQTVPQGQDKTLRSLHSALLPEVIFNVAYISTPNARRMAFQAVGQSLDLRLTSAFIVPAANLMGSISKSINHVQEASAGWGSSFGPEKMPKEDDHNALSQTPANGPNASDRPWNLFGKKRLESMLIDADFAGAVVHVSSKRNFSNAARISKLNRPSLAGKYGQFNADDSGSGAVLRSPGLAWKLEFSDNGHDDPTVSGEIKIDASSNILYPSVVPLVLDIVSSVQEVVGREKTTAKKPNPSPPFLQPQQSGAEDTILTADPSAVLGRTKLNLGLRICRQEFSLSCQPIARVAATTSFESIYFTANTVTSTDHGNFFAISGTFDRLKASVQHVYSRESTGSVEIQRTTLSLMNSKHVSGTSGVSAILNVSPMKVTINAKQVQDFLLFREIWYPAELRDRNTAPVAKLTTENSQGHLMQRYQQVAATAAFPWTATISIAALDVAVDLGQAIGKSVFRIAEFWISSKKTSDWEQNLCLGFQRISIDCSGRLSGFIALQDFKLRTSIQWPKREQALNETPLVQASIGFNALRIKAAFDYQAFLVADITRLELLMYNVREDTAGRGDRLVAIFDGEAVQIFGTTTSTAQAVALYQAIKRLTQERQENFQSSLREIEKFMKRKSSTTVRYSSQPSDCLKLPGEERLAKAPISLDTDVVVTLKALNLGVFPSTFSDHQVFKIEALNAYARFAASLEAGRVHSILKLTLGQLRIGLAGVRNGEAPRALSEISVNDVVQRATGSRGGTILKVPQVSAVMETWQTPESNLIDYIFKSAFEGKVEVGWNYSRISFIRGMWANHSRSVEATWGKELLPMATVKITGVPEGEGERKEGEQQKITAEVNVPQSKYTYVALEPPVIETPQLRDMGEATPPLEWIGLHRERLPNLTHQIVIVSLLELAGEVDDAYSRILGAS
ncbi:uncharacterized protein J7T54_003277 [Emericellopsis cladophorae]|uniref:Protein CSF1 n=1 Tax=Emericellopsis cladophorae TaxID=2686198 RepID=A0A9P9Y199_9HYPO|nr:uncharacterized protein J7T54_003277 [Emericellopsis cladophorae]KAI6781109.1 hypothetical protein J7T54_003277 [Emericellopsis cladophorae]